MSHRRLYRLTVYAMWGALLFATTFVMKVLPNIHLLALLIIVLTRVYRAGALIPIYIYVMAEGLLQGFSEWWVPYLYIWTVLWALVMLLPSGMSEKTEAICCSALGFLHGISFGLMWAPYHAFLNGLTFEGMLLWAVSGIGYDIIHGVSNLAACTLAVPLIRLVRRLEKTHIY